MRALITRPREDAEGLAHQLRRRGLEVVVEPLLRIVPRPGATVPLEGVQAVLATSANGVRALAAATPERSLPVLAVGDASARCARDLGFARVLSAGGDADSLAALVCGTLRPENGALIHAAGTAVAGDVTGKLTAAGYRVTRTVLYDAVPVEALSDSLLEELREGKIDLALFFSPRTARTFVSLVRRHGLAESCRAVAAYCLSAAVAAELAGVAWRRLRVATQPDQPSLLAALDAEIPAD